MPTSSSPAGGDKNLSLGDLFTGFLTIGLLGFGGIAQSALYVITERRKWLSAKDYVELLGVCTMLPGGNIVNATVIIGARNQGWLGSVTSVGALMLAPLAILLAIAVAYDHFSYIPEVRAATTAAGSAASGLIFATAVRLAKAADRTLAALIAGVATFIVVAVLSQPLWVVALVIAPAAFAWTLFAGRRT